MNSTLWVTILCGYFVGSIPFGLFVARLFGGIDIRQHGSGNIGATNVGRVMGFRWFLVVFGLDGLKGLLPTLSARLLSAEEVTPLLTTAIPVLTGLATILGHMFPCWLKFRGGKGVATALGVVLVLAPIASLIAAIVFGLTFLRWRTVSVSSLSAAILFAISQMLLLKPTPWAGDVWPLGLFSVIVPGLIIYRHKSNIVRLWRGKELVFNKSTAATVPVEAEASEQQS